MFVQVACTYTLVFASRVARVCLTLHIPCAFCLLLVRDTCCVLCDFSDVGAPSGSRVIVGCCSASRHCFRGIRYV